jgi:hypothetical protein
MENRKKRFTEALIQTANDGGPVCVIDLDGKYETPISQAADLDLDVKISQGSGAGASLNEIAAKPARNAPYYRRFIRSKF